MRAFNIMESYRKSIIIDNEKWVEEHKEHLFPNDYKKTQNYVFNNHPNHGEVAYCWEHWKGDETIEQLAARANAITRVCYELLGNNAWKRGDPYEWKIKGDMAVGDLIADKAFIALHHSNPQIRNLYHAYVEDWLELRDRRLKGEE